MAIVAAAAPPGSANTQMVYLRIDGLRVLPPVTKRRGWEDLKILVESEQPSAVVHKDDDTVAFQIYAYDSAEARSERKAPIWSRPLQTSRCLLGLPEIFTPAQLWAAVYSRLHDEYPDGENDLEARLTAG